MSCFWCHSDYSELCIKCGLVSSCTSHWVLHRSLDGKHCFPFKVMVDDVLGRRLVAVRDINQMEVIMEDRPVAVGPVHSTLPVCLNCYNYVNLDVVCLDCGFPMCDEDCASGLNHSLECKVFKDAGVKVRITRFDQPAAEYQAIMVLRLLRSGDLDLMRTNMLTDHVDMLGDLERSVYTENVVEVIRNKLKLKQFSSQEIFRYISIIRTNACAVSAGEGKGTLRILHPSLATMNHSCVVNTRVFKRKDHVVCVRAQTPILQGQEIFNKYTSFFEGKIERSQLLQDNWHFFCECPRCEDPSDLGSNFDSLICSKCRGAMLPQSNDPGSPWVCDECGDLITREKVQILEEKLAKKISQSIGDFKLLEALLVDNLNQFHINQHQQVFIKVQIILQLGKMMEAQARVGKAWSLKQVKRKVDLCSQVLDVINKIDPGLSDIKSQILYEMSAPKLMLLQYYFTTGKHQIMEVKEEMENLIVAVKNVCDNHEVFEERKDTDMVKTANALLKDAKEFYTEAIVKKTS